MGPLLYPCSACGALTPRRRCPAHAHPPRDPSRPVGRGGGGGHRWRRLVAQVIERRDGAQCHLWGRYGATSADHVVPVARGGTDDLANLRAAHLSCNLARGARDAPAGSAPLAHTGQTTRPA